MNWLDFVLIFLVGCLLAFAVWLYRRGNKKGGCHCSNCDSCAACKKKKKDKKKGEPPLE